MVEKITTITVKERIRDELERTKMFPNEKLEKNIWRHYCRSEFLKYKEGKKRVVITLTDEFKNFKQNGEIQQITDAYVVLRNNVSKILNVTGFRDIKKIEELK